MMSSSTGGAATAGGTNFEARVAAWYAVHMLAESGAPAVPGRGSDVRLEYVRCQTGEPLDDVLVGFSEGGHDFVQAKRTLSLETAESSELAKVFEQCVRQFVPTADEQGNRPWDRELDPSSDRLVIAVGAGTPATVRVDLGRVLTRVRGLHQKQPLGDAATNEQERRALSVALTHIERSWKEHTGSDASESEIRSVLRLTSIEDLDLEGDGKSEQGVLQILRSSILRDPTRDRAAWKFLCETTADLAQRQSGISRHELESALRDAGFQFRGVRSYEEDVSRLEKYTDDTLELLERHTGFESGGDTIRLERDVAEVISALCENHSFAVVGDPGAGKSAALYESAILSRTNGIGVLALSATDVTASNLGELRSHLGLEHGIIEVLENWREADRGVVYIDALDAARDESAACTLRNLVDLVSKKLPRWGIVATVRTYDLKQGIQYQELFRGSIDELPDRYRRGDFATVKHVYVPHLDDDEIRVVGDRAPKLRPLIESASAAMRKLLRVPFNIQLLAQLVDSGADLSALRPVETQGELLELYWKHRVLGDDGHGDARETILAEITERMVLARQLRADRRSLKLDSDGSLRLKELLSADVLADAAGHDPYVITFSHHVLFDYAASRLLLSRDPTEFSTYLSTDPELLFVLRPSLVLHFHELWRADRTGFWNAVIALIAHEEVPSIGEVIGPAAAVDLARKLEDFQPLLSILDDGYDSRSIAAAKAIRYVAASRVSDGETSMVGPNAGPWAELAEVLAERLRGDLVITVRNLILNLTEQRKKMTDEQSQSTGRAARLLLEFAESESSENRNLILTAITLVTRTAASDVAGSVSLLRRCFDPRRVETFGYEELPVIAREVDDLIELDPTFVRDLYGAAFAFVETSEKPTSLSDSAVFSLTSNRAQDYQGALYSLTSSFSRFMELATVEATSALIFTVDAHVLRRHRPVSGGFQDETFYVGDTIARIRTDYSRIWDASAHNDVADMLQTFEDRLVSLAVAKDEDALREVIAVLVRENRVAAIWRRLIRAGTKQPECFGPMLAPLIQHPMLLCHDTRALAIQLVPRIYPYLGEEERARVDELLLSLPGGIDGDAREARETIRSEIVSRLPRDQTFAPSSTSFPRVAEVTDNAASGSTLDHDEADAQPGYLDEEDRLRLEGVDPRKPANKQVLSLIEPVNTFADSYRNDDPSKEAIESVLPEIETLRSATGDAESEGAHLIVIDEARLAVAAACSVIPKCRTLSSDSQAVALAREVLMKAARSLNPELNDEIEASWNESGGSWSSADRVEAARVLMALALHPDACDEELLNEIEDLSSDPVAAVRYHVVDRVFWLYETARERMWKILEDRVAREIRGGLALALVGRLGPLLRTDDPRALTLIIKLMERFQSSHEVVRSALSALGQHAIWTGDEECFRHVDRVIAEIPRAPENAESFVHIISQPLTHGGLDDQAAALVRVRALDIMTRLLSAAIDEYRKATRGVDPSLVAEPDIERLRSVGEIVVSIARVVYMASNSKGWDASPPPEAIRRRLYDEAPALFDLLTDTGVAAATHSVLETLQLLIPLEPEEVFLRIRRLLRASHEVGYPQDMMAAPLIVRVVERYLADYRHLFQTNPEMREALTDVLNLFIESGWPQALRLAARLEDVFR